MRYVQLTQQNNKPILINFNYIIAIQETDEGSRVYVRENGFIDVKDSYINIIKLGKEKN
jgi:hypothetical protein